MTKLFDNISDKQKEKIIKTLEAEIIIGSPKLPFSSFKQRPNAIYFIETGYLEINETDQNGKKTKIDILEENDIFSTLFMPLKTNDLEINFLEETEIYIIDYEQIFHNKDLLKTYYQQFIQNLFSIMKEKSEEKNERIQILTQKTIRNKLLEYFKISSKKHKSKYIYLPFNFTDLADYLGVDRCAMSRELKYLKEEGFIEIKSKRITLLKENRDFLYKYI